jgi:hypothetical protein
VRATPFFSPPTGFLFFHGAGPWAISQPDPPCTRPHHAARQPPSPLCPCPYQRWAPPSAMPHDVPDRTGSCRTILSPLFSSSASMQAVGAPISPTLRARLPHPLFPLASSALDSATPCDRHRAPVTPFPRRNWSRHHCPSTSPMSAAPMCSLFDFVGPSSLPSPSSGCRSRHRSPMPETPPTKPPHWWPPPLVSPSHHGITRLPHHTTLVLKVQTSSHRSHHAAGMGWSWAILAAGPGQPCWASGQKWPTTIHLISVFWIPFSI